MQLAVKEAPRGFFDKLKGVRGRMAPHSFCNSQLVFKYRTMPSQMPLTSLS